MKVADILARKVAVVITIKPSDPVGELSQLLRERRIGAAVVSSDGQKVDGVISEPDVAYALAVHASALHTLPVAALMTKTVITCTRSDSIALIASL